jgi:hypothetical protein
VTRDEFVFAIGFQGDAAIVDSRAMKRHRKLTTMELAEEGLYRAAFCSAIYSSSEEEMDSFITRFAEKTGMQDLTEERLQRLFGVYTVPDQIRRIVTV